MSPTEDAPTASTPRHDETSPLLAKNRPQSNYDDPAVENGESSGPAGRAEDADDPPLAEEPSNRKLALMLGSIYVGVFLAALGMR